jgi:hypothetical protein
MRWTIGADVSQRGLTPPSAQGDDFNDFTLSYCRNTDNTLLVYQFFYYLVTSRFGQGNLLHPVTSQQPVVSEARVRVGI